MEPIFSTEDIVMQMATEGALFKVRLSFEVIFWPGLYYTQGRDSGNNFSFPVQSSFLKLNDNDVKSLLNGYPIFWSRLFSFPGTRFWKRFDTKWLPDIKGTLKRHGTARNLQNEKVVSSISDPRYEFQFQF